MTDARHPEPQTAIAVHDSPRSTMVCLFRTLRGYQGGRTDPFDFASVPGGDCDDSLAKLGYRRAEDWQPVPGEPWKGVAYVKVERVGA